MAIQARCSCGKTIAADDKFAGRRVKCPDCGEPISIPGASTAQSVSSSLNVSCQCGKSFAAKSALAGRTVECPSCGQPVSIPNEQAETVAHGSAGDDLEAVGSDMAGLLDEIGMQATRTGVRCPNCRSDLEPAAILCVACGYNLETGKLLKTDSFVAKSKFSGVGAPTEKTKSGKSKFGFLGGLFGKK